MEDYLYVLRNIESDTLDKLYKLCYITGEQVCVSDVRRYFTSKL